LKANEHFEEFVKEAAMLQSLNHPNILRFFGIHTTSNREHFLVMEYMRKGSLDGVLKGTNVLNGRRRLMVAVVVIAEDEVLPFWPIHRWYSTN